MTEVPRLFVIARRPSYRARTATGHEERSPPPRLSGRCRFRKRSVVVDEFGSCSAPTTDLRRLCSTTDEEVNVAIIDEPDAKPTDEAFWKDARVVIASVKGRSPDHPAMTRMRRKRPITGAVTEPMGSATNGHSPR